MLTSKIPLTEETLGFQYFLNLFIVLLGLMAQKPGEKKAVLYNRRAPDDWASWEATVIAETKVNEWLYLTSEDVHVKKTSQKSYFLRDKCEQREIKSRWDECMAM